MILLVGAYILNKVLSIFGHILLDFMQIVQDNMKELFQDIHIDSIMTFLRQINLFNKI